MHETVARARFPLEKVKKLRGWEHFWQMRSAKCARDCSESSIAQKKRIKLSRSEQFWKMRSIHSFQFIHFNSFIHCICFHVINFLSFQLTFFQLTKNSYKQTVPIAMSSFRNFRLAKHCLHLHPIRSHL